MANRIPFAAVLFIALAPLLLLIPLAFLMLDKSPTLFPLRFPEVRDAKIETRADVGFGGKPAADDSYFDSSVFIITIVILAYYAAFATFIFIKQKAFQHERLPAREAVDLSSCGKDELCRIKILLEALYSDPRIATGTICKKTGINRARVCRLIEEEYGLSFKQLINRMRIEEAKRLLKETDRKIHAIAFDLGFNDISYFTKVFKHEEGLSPYEFREKHDKRDIFRPVEQHETGRKRSKS